VGCFTLANPLPSQAGHFASAIGSFDLSIFIGAPKDDNTTIGRAFPTALLPPLNLQFDANKLAVDFEDHTGDFKRFPNGG
jgi:hypothetical protein